MENKDRGSKSIVKEGYISQKSSRDLLPENHLNIFYCDLCDLRISGGENNYQQHLKGRKHSSAKYRNKQKYMHNCDYCGGYFEGIRAFDTHFCIKANQNRNLQEINNKRSADTNNNNCSDTLIDTAIRLKILYEKIFKRHLVNYKARNEDCKKDLEQRVLNNNEINYTDFGKAAKCSDCKKRLFSDECLAYKPFKKNKVEECTDDEYLMEVISLEDPKLFKQPKCVKFYENNGEPMKFSFNEEDSISFCAKIVIKKKKN